MTTLFPYLEAAFAAIGFVVVALIVTAWIWPDEEHGDRWRF